MNVNHSTRFILWRTAIVEISEKGRLRHNKILIGDISDILTSTA